MNNPLDSGTFFLYKLRTRSLRVAMRLTGSDVAILLAHAPTEHCGAFHTMR